MKGIITIEGLVKTAASLSKSSLEILSDQWEKRASLYARDADRLKKNLQETESERLAEMSRTYKEAAARLRELADEQRT